MLQDLPGKGATFPNPEEGSSSPFQNKEAGVGNAAVPAANQGSSQKFCLEDKALTEQLLGPAESHNSPAVLSTLSPL